MYDSFFLLELELEYSDIKLNEIPSNTSLYLSVESNISLYLSVESLTSLREVLNSLLGRLIEELPLEPTIHAKRGSPKTLN